MFDLSQLGVKFGLLLGAVFFFSILYWALKTIFLGKALAAATRRVWVANFVLIVASDTSRFLSMHHRL